MKRLIAYLVGFGLLCFFAVLLQMPVQAGMATYQSRLTEAKQALHIGVGGITLDIYRDFRLGFADGSQDKSFADFGQNYQIAHTFDVILTDLVQRPDERYSLDKATLSSMGLTPSEANVTALRNSIRTIFRDLTTTHLRDILNPGTQLFIYYDSTSQSFKHQLNAQPLGKPYYEITSGHILDFAFVDGATLGAEEAMENMNPKLDGQFKKFKIHRESNAITGICNQCLDQSQAKRGLGFCYLAGLAKGDAMRDQLRSTATGRASLSNDRIAVNRKTITAGDGAPR